MFDFTKHDLFLAFNLFKMNVRDRYLGSSLGSFWALANPFFMLAVYTFVFGFVFKVRLPGAETTLGYVIWLISGYGPWIATTEALMAATTSVTGASGLIKNMAFKTELLPLSSVLVGCISLCVSLVFLTLLMIVDSNMPSWHVFWLPVIIFLQFFLVASIGLWLAAVNVFVRDLSMVLPNILTIIMFASPIFYPLESMPSIVQTLSVANPFYVIVDSYRSVTLYHQHPSFPGLLYVFAISAAIFTFGLASFRRAKGFFSSAL